MIKLRLGFSDDTASFFNKMTRKVTGGPGHAVVEANLNGDEVVYESVWKVDPGTHKSGVRWIPLSQLKEWAAAGPQTRLYYTVPETGYLPLTDEEAAFAVSRLKDAIPIVRYAKLQLAQNLLARTGLRLGFGGGSETQWTCCETPVRARVIPARWWDLLGLDGINADEIWPGGSSRYSLEAGARRIVQAYGVRE